MLDSIVKLNTVIVGLVLFVTLILVPFGSKSIKINIPIKIEKEKTESSAKVAGAYAFIPSLTPTLTPSPTPLPTATPVPVAKPTIINIPKINVTAEIVDVGILTGHIMEIPLDPLTVGWYKNSFKPGENGAAILNGHFDDANGQPAIFYRLEELDEGDHILVTTEDGMTLTFEVDLVFSHPLEDFPEDIVYGEFEGKGLKLITCDGVWDSIQNIYSNRLIVVSRLISKEVSAL